MKTAKTKTEKYGSTDMPRIRMTRMKEPVLEYIEDDDVYEKVADAFDEYLDSCEFDEIIDDNDSEEIRNLDGNLGRSAVPVRQRSSRSFFALVIAT